MERWTLDLASACLLTGLALLCRWTKPRRNKKLHRLALHSRCAEWRNSICSCHLGGCLRGRICAFRSKRS